MMRVLLIFLGLLCFAQNAMAQDDLDYQYFSRLPVQHEGRIKPVDSFARNFLNAFNGHDSLGSLSAESWLAETLFDPAQALHRPTFRIFRPQILDLPIRENKYYSYAEITPALFAKRNVLQQLSEADPKKWSKDQAELMRIQDNSILYTQLLRSFSFLLPLNISVPNVLAKDWKITEEKPFTVQDYKRYSERLKARVQTIIRKSGDDPSHYSDSEKQIAQFAFEMQTLEQAGEDNVLFRVVPGQWEGANGAWFSPWALMQAGQGSTETTAYLKLWQSMAAAYLRHDGAAWNAATKEAAATAENFAPGSKLGLEIAYNNWHPLTVALVLYFLAFTGFVLQWRMTAMAALAGGWVFNAAAIIARVFILERPPVGTLYESIIFVAMICVAVSLFLEVVRKDGTGLVIGALSGMILLFTAESFAEDDTMKMLVAVLNTNFWLGTHVLCITIGYGWCLITSLLSHLWLIRRATGRKADNLITPIKTLGLIALLFTAIGTILGGIWADQSWGRFWGWDPKENGALLIVLWLIWLLHGQISGHIKRLPYIAAMAALSIIVALAWFGVNLLSVGLHSYGFITGVAAGLVVFCAVEILLIGGLWYRAAKAAPTP